MNPDEPAFSVGVPLVSESRLTIRAEFAKAAMHAILSKRGASDRQDIVAEHAVSYADALIAELNKTK